MNLKSLLHSFERVAARMCRLFIANVYCAELTSEMNAERPDDMNKKKLVFLRLLAENQFHGRCF